MQSIYVFVLSMFVLTEILLYINTYVFRDFILYLVIWFDQVKFSS